MLLITYWFPGIGILCQTNSVVASRYDSILSMMKDEGWSKVVGFGSKFEKRCAQFSSHYPHAKVQSGDEIMKEVMQY